jgi:hypothetical protein
VTFADDYFVNDRPEENDKEDYAGTPSKGVEQPFDSALPFPKVFVLFCRW